jgi:hypothetical protein
MRDDLKNRISKADERAVNLFKRYPVVGGSVLVIGILIGLALGWWLL